MEIENKFKYLVGGYYGIRTMDNYDLKEYVLKNIEDYIKDFLKENPISDCYEKAKQYEKELSYKTKLQDSLLVLHEIDAPIELILIVKAKLKEE